MALDARIYCNSCAFRHVFRSPRLASFPLRLRSEFDPEDCRVPFPSNDSRGVGDAEGRLLDARLDLPPMPSTPPCTATINIRLGIPRRRRGS